MWLTQAFNLLYTLNTHTMAKRFTDTDKYRKQFIRALEPELKLIWDFIYHECDYAGIWIVDMELADFLLFNGKKQHKAADVLWAFNEDEPRVIPFAKGKKWFIPQFIFFQYGQLRATVSTHRRVIEKLEQHKLMGAYETNDYTQIMPGADPAPEPTVQPTVKDADKDKDKDKDRDKGARIDKVAKYRPLVHELLAYFPKETQPAFASTEEDKWADTLRLLIEHDGHTAVDIRLVVQWATQHDFWGINFLSLRKLRQKDKNGTYFINRFKIEMTHEHTKTNKSGADYADTLNKIANRYAGTDAGNQGAD